jgi:uncharacterized protein (TIGR02118 family)
MPLLHAGFSFGYPFRKSSQWLTRHYNREPAIMIKLIYCITKKAGMTDEQFVNYWRNVHAPLGARIPGVRKFVQSRRINVAGDKNQGDFDGMVELWFDSVEALLAARQSPEWKASTADEVNFVQLTKVAYFVSEEHVVFDDSGPD